ncbi:MAG TPA: hypothetical protein VN700_08690 [Vicinamibacterales bacterium]|nr:hypothetical protein [Vicinamibacterales bacterium]
MSVVIVAALAFASQPPMAAASAGPDRTSWVEPFDIVVTGAEGCSGEDVHVFGTLDLRVQTVVSGKGDVHVSFHLTPNLTGIGLTSGNAYNPVGPTSTTDFIDGNGPRVSSGINIINLISRGSSGNLVLHEAYQLTVNANGVVTVDSHTFKGGCRG